MLSDRRSDLLCGTKLTCEQSKRMSVKEIQTGLGAEISLEGHTDCRPLLHLIAVFIPVLPTKFSRKARRGRGSKSGW